MMPEDPKPFTLPPSPGPATPASSTVDPEADAPAPTAEPAAPATSPAVVKFHSCRWRAQPDEGSFCTHRDVLPLAGREGFKAEAWCPDCAFFKVRRAPRKRPDY
jgi:hypothetical protein